MQLEFAKLFVLVQTIAEKQVAPSAEQSRDDGLEDVFTFPITSQGSLADLELRLSSDLLFQRRIVSLYLHLYFVFEF